MFRKRSSESNERIGVAEEGKPGGFSPNEFYSTKDTTSGNNINTSINVSSRRKHSGESKLRQFRGKKFSGIQYDVEDDVNSDVASVLNPLRQKNTKSTIKMEHIVTYFTFFLIFLPSILAVIVPVMFPNYQTKFDIADLMTDILMIVLVSWFIRFSIEWPWTWLKDIKRVKNKLINYTNSNNTIYRGIPENTPEMQLNKQILISNILLICKLIRAEKIALILCFSGAIFGAFIMIIARKYIIIEETRRKIVFNNMNISLFIFWEIFRLVLYVSESLQYSTVTNAQERIKNHGNDYNLITEETLYQYLPQDSKQENNNSNIFNEIILKFKYIASKFYDITSEFEKKYEDLKKSYEEKITNLQKENHDQNFLIEEILKTQNNEFTRMNLMMGKMEKSLYLVNKPTDHSSLDSNNKVYLKPFPLNLSIQKNLENMPNNLRLDTINEEKPFSDSLQSNLHQNRSSSNSSYNDGMYENQNYDQNSSKLPISSQENDESVKKEEIIDSLHYSLHGLPFTSTIKDLVSRDSHIIQDPLAKANINELVFYESEIDDSNFELRYNDLQTHSIVEETMFLDYILSKFKAVFHKLSLKKYIRAEFEIKRLNEALLSFTGINTNQMKIIFTRKYLKNFFWKLSMKHIIQNIEFFNVYTMELYNYYVSPMRRAEAALLLIFTEIPFNFLRVYFNIIVFIPRVIIRFIFIRSVTKNEEKIDKLTNTSGDEGMKEFHLVPNQFSEADSNIHYTKTRGIVANKISKHYSSIILSNKPNDQIIINPATLCDKGF